jgi:tetratricopeptide (TPR) repeat protein
MNSHRQWSAAFLVALVALSPLALDAASALAEASPPSESPVLMVDTQVPSPEIPDPLTMKAVSFLKDGKLQQAIEAGEQATKTTPRNWLSHAMLSYLYWQEGNAGDAVGEGQKAVGCAPYTPTALVNLADIYQLLGNYTDATPLYDRARKVDGANWVPWIGLARCYLRNYRPGETLKILKEMAATSSESFPWHYQLGKMYMIIDKPSLAVAPLSRAVTLAGSAEQKIASRSELLVALIRDNQMDAANNVKRESFQDSCPTSGEPYTLAADKLLSAASADQGRELLKTAKDNLHNMTDSESFFRLGRIFEEKADAADVDATRADWLVNAQTAFARAIDLNQAPSKYHIALAGIFDRQGKSAEMSRELSQSNQFDRDDLLGPFLASRAQASGASAKEAIADAKDAGDQTAARKLDMTVVDFGVSGLTCPCQMTRIESALQKMGGVVVLNTTRVKPYSVTMLLDQSATTTDKVLAALPEMAYLSGPAVKEQLDVKFNVTSQKPAHTFYEAIELSQPVQYGSVLNYPRGFELIQPDMPVPAVADQARPEM